MKRYGFSKVAAAMPRVAIADCATNAARIIALMQQADRRGVEVICFPELSVTGATCGDLFLQSHLLESAQRALVQIAEATEQMSLTAIVGLPVAVGGRLYNCAAVVSGGEIRGLVPKRNITSTIQMNDGRWFASGADVEYRVVDIAGRSVDFDADMLFVCGDMRFGVEMEADLRGVIPSSVHAATAGAQLIFCLASSAEQVAEYEHLCALIEQHSRRITAAYVYCSAGFGESSTDMAFTPNALIAENGTILNRTERFSIEEQLLVSDVDISYLDTVRLRQASFKREPLMDEYFVVECHAAEAKSKEVAFDREIDSMPFVPSAEDALDKRCREVLEIQAVALAQRLSATGCRKVVLGVSGGLDSTLALLAIVRTFDKLSLDREGIIGVTMPGFGTTGRTYNNAVDLMRSLGITMREISIKAACEQHFADIGLSADDRSVSYENSQARERTQILMDVANMCGAMVIGTGDLSEQALGWATYNGDHMSMYGVNAAVPKTLVRHLVRWYAEREATAEVSRILLDVVDTPVSPELLPANDKGEIAQKTEDLVGPYELHDFFLYNFVRRGFSPEKIEFLARHAFEGRYDNATIRKWLTTFLRRFFSQQFKRSAMPDGPKIGSVTLSPRGGWIMPSDATVREWIEIKNE